MLSLLWRSGRSSGGQVPGVSLGPLQHRPRYKNTVGENYTGAVQYGGQFPQTTLGSSLSNSCKIGMCSSSIQVDARLGFFA